MVIVTVMKVINIEQTDCKNDIFLWLDAAKCSFDDDKHLSCGIKKARKRTFSSSSSISFLKQL